MQTGCVLKISRDRLDKKLAKKECQIRQEWGYITLED
jgi:hypothetical protein